MTSEQIRFSLQFFMPAGNVIFLFTDIESSTMLAQKFPDIYQSILERHDSVLKKNIEDNKGFVFKKIGDSVCASFDSDENAINAAIQIQKNLKSEFNNDYEIKVRMGLHKGEAEYLNGDYIGYVTLSRVQRLMSIAHGGQILISKDLRDSIKNIDNKYIVKDFGLRKLKDIIIPEHIYQLSTEELQNEFPPIVSIHARQNNLPGQVSGFIGREKEISEIKNIFSKTRLLSLIGPGGTGKTRLAIKVASELIDEFENGIWLLDLSPIINPEIVIKELLNILGLKEEAGVDTLETVKAFLKDKKMILLFDNSEHLLEKCGTIVQNLLSFCPGVRIISTSREPFNLPGEIIFRIPPLSIPGNLKDESFESLSEYESVKLFLNCASSINSKFELTETNIHTVAELCKHLDGIPLAIELAAKRISVLNVEKIYERLSDRFKLLTIGNSTAHPRQKTLRALIDWSYDLLSFKEQRLFQCLSVFQGGWTLEAAELICSDENYDDSEIMDLLNGLLDKSLIFSIDENGMCRFNMLETIRVYAMEKLTDKANVFVKKIHYYVKLTDLNLQLQNGMERYEWVKTIKSEIDNIRICIDKALELSLTEAAELSLNTYEYWQEKGHFSEGLETLTKVFESGISFDELTRAKLMEKLSQLCNCTGKSELFEKYARESLVIYKKYDYKEGMILSLNLLGFKSFLESDDAVAINFFEQALALCNEINSKNKGNILLSLSRVYCNFADKTKAIELSEEALLLLKKENYSREEAYALISLSIILSRTLQLLNIKKAVQYAEESIAISKTLDDRYLDAINLIQLGSLYLIYLNDLKNAEYVLLEAYKINKDYGYKINLYPNEIYLGHLYLLLNKPEQAGIYYFEYLKRRDKLESEFFIKDIFLGTAIACYKKNIFDKAASLIGTFDKLAADDKYKSLLYVNFKFESEQSELKNKSGEENFMKYYNDGKSMTIDEAVNAILELQDFELSSVIEQ